MQTDDIGFYIYLIAALVVICIWLYSKLTKEKKQRDKLVKENTRLIADNALLESEHLKFQLQPHTLRNMVATLYVASKNLYKGSEALCDTVDYILYQGNKHLVSIHDELNFLEKYKSLQGNFVYQIDSIKIDKSQLNTDSKYYLTPCIPHLITAYFVENAFKHGDKSHPDFLRISIKLSEKTFEFNVVNKIISNQKINKGGIGLENMRKRLDVLFADKFDVKFSRNEQEYHSSLVIRFI